MKELSELGKFSLILADPPWSYKDLGHSRRIDRQYSTLSLYKICNLPIAHVAADDCVLFLWATAPLLPDALEVMRMWGFKYKSNIVWDKLLFGMGHYARIRHEHLLIGVRGKPGTSAVHNLPSVISARRGKHSVKPVEAYEYIEAMYPRASKLELFARNARPGWSVWGNESESGPAPVKTYDEVRCA